MGFPLVKGSIPPKWQGHHHRKLDVRPINIAYSSSYEDYDDEGGGVRGRRHPRDDLSDFKIKVLDFNNNLKSENYLD